MLRTFVWVGGCVLSVLCWWVLIVAAFAVLTVLAPNADAADMPTADVALVLAVDASGSIDLDEMKLQREGYAAALTHPDVIQAITEGAHGRILVAYFEWSDCSSQGIRVKWAVIDGVESARQVAALIVQPGKAVVSGSTCISGALKVAGALLATVPGQAERNVIDISGDGTDPDVFTVEGVRDGLISQGVTINGLPVLGSADGNVEAYYENFVIGGPGHFLEPARGFQDIEPALRRKLIVEIG